MILPLLLQPIVENAIIHGLEEKEVGGMVLINVAYLRESENPQKLLEGNFFSAVNATPLFSNT